MVIFDSYQLWGDFYLHVADSIRISRYFRAASNSGGNNNNLNPTPLPPANVNSSEDQDRKDFLEWFRGFVDAEGFFIIRPNRGS